MKIRGGVPQSTTEFQEILYLTVDFARISHLLFIFQFHLDGLDPPFQFMVFYEAKNGYRQMMCIWQRS